MKINFSAVITNLDGKPMKQPALEGADSPDATLAWIAAEAMLRSVTDKEGEAKYKVYSLAMKIGGGGEIDLPPEEIALIKAKVGEAYGPLIVGRAFDLLNG